MASEIEYVGASSDDDFLGLAAGLAGKAGLIAGRGTLEQLLTRVAGFAMLAVPGADGAGVTMLKSGQPDTIVASETFVRDVDLNSVPPGRGAVHLRGGAGHHDEFRGAERVRARTRGVRRVVAAHR